MLIVVCLSLFTMPVVLALHPFDVNECETFLRVEKSSSLLQFSTLGTHLRAQVLCEGSSLNLKGKF